MKPSELALGSPTAASEPVAEVAEADRQERDTSSPPGAWGELEVHGPSRQPQTKPTPPKKRSAEKQSGRRTGRILRDKQLTKEQRQKIEQARMMKQQTVDVVSADGATNTFDLRRMRATKYSDVASTEAAERGDTAARYPVGVGRGPRLGDETRSTWSMRAAQSSFHIQVFL